MTMVVKLDNQFSPRLPGDKIAIDERQSAKKKIKAIETVNCYQVEIVCIVSHNINV